MGSIIASVAFKKTFKEVVRYLKEKAIPSLKIELADVNNSYLKASNVENVKTIWQVDKKVNLNEFYYPSSIFVDANKILVESLEALPSNGKIVIQGIAGQGKSIFLRYLVGKELKEGKKIPLFVELRKISSKISLKKLIRDSVREVGIDIDISHLGYVYKSNKFTIILDAFDEIPESELKRTLTYLESLCAKFYNQQIIISARPYSDIQMVPYFNVYDLAPLKPKDFKPILLNFFDGNVDTVDKIISSINKNSANIEQLLTTPLLLTLLSVTYKSYNKVPSQLHEFYENLFHLLVNRHDSTKPGFRREYKSKLNERELEELFCAFSFFCMKGGQDSFKKREAIQIVNMAMKLANIKSASENDFLRDCVKNTCLIVEEGFYYHFIHKSIREYHAASYIKYSSSDLKEKFYSAAVLNSAKYNNELYFLSIIDKYLYNKFFLLPLYRKIFSLFSYDEKTKEIDISCFNNIEISADEYGNVNSVDFDGIHDVDTSYFTVNKQIYDIILSNFHNIDFRITASSYRLKDIDISSYVRDEIKKAMVKWCSNTYEIYKNLCLEVDNEKRIIEELKF